MNRIRVLRKKNKMTAEELAEFLEITVRHLYDIEVGKVPLGDERIKKLCSFFNVTSDYLLGISSVPPPAEPNEDDDNFSIGLLSRGDINTAKLERIINRAVKKALLEREKERRGNGEDC